MHLIVAIKISLQKKSSFRIFDSRSNLTQIKTDGKNHKQLHFFLSERNFSFNSEMSLWPWFCWITSNRGVCRILFFINVSRFVFSNFETISESTIKMIRTEKEIRNQNLKTKWRKKSVCQTHTHVIWLETEEKMCI